MNSVARQHRRTQLVLQPMAGGKSTTQFCYGVMINGFFEPVSHSFAAWVVGEFNRQRGGCSCSNSAGTTPTGEGEQSTLSDMTEKNSGSYSVSLAMNTTAHCHLSNSSRNTHGWMRNPQIDRYSFEKSFIINEYSLMILGELPHD